MSRKYLQLVVPGLALQQARAQLGLSPSGASDAVDPTQTAGVKQAAATLKQAQLNRDRMARLFQEQLIPRSDLDTAEANFGVADGRYQEATETAGVVAVGMRDEDRADAAEVGSKLGQAARHTLAGIDDILRAVDDQQVRGLRPPAGRRGAGPGAERDKAGAGFWRAAGLRPAAGYQHQSADGDKNHG